MNHPSLDIIDNFLPISPTIATAGQPTVEQFALISSAGYETVINLALTESPQAIPLEPQIVKNLGMEYIHIPVVWERPTEASFHRFLTVMHTHRQQRKFIHCVANKRVSAFLYLYHRLASELPPETASSYLHQIWQPNEVWQEFIDRVVSSVQNS